VIYSKIDNDSVIHSCIGIKDDILINLE